MFSKEVVVRCESGLHNRQATYFVQKANEFESSIWLESGNRTAAGPTVPPGGLYMTHLWYDDGVAQFEAGSDWTK